jgi:hypothetical protein
MSVSMETVPRATLQPWFVTGFADAQASFTFSRGGRGHVDLYFAIKRPSGERSLLEAIRSFFEGAGRIYEVKSRKASYYRVSRPDELRQVVAHFEQYPLQSPIKREVYGVWREMVLHKRIFGAEGGERLSKLCRQLSGLTHAQTT